MAALLEGTPPMAKLAPREPLAELPPAFSVERMTATVRALSAPELKGRGLGTAGDRSRRGPDRRRHERSRARGPSHRSRDEQRHRRPARHEAGMGGIERRRRRALRPPRRRQGGDGAPGRRRQRQRRRRPSRAGPSDGVERPRFAHRDLRRLHGRGVGTLGIEALRRGDVGVARVEGDRHGQPRYGRTPVRRKDPRARVEFRERVDSHRQRSRLRDGSARRSRR